MATTKKRKPNNLYVTKKLQTELQSLIAYGCYDSPSVLKAGDSAKKSDIMKKIHDLYMPLMGKGDHFSQVEMFLEGKGKYKYLFEKSDDDTNNSTVIIPEIMHCIKGKTISVNEECIDKSLLTRKNLSNFVDVTSKSLYRHAKEVKANCKKALAICTSESSPYRNFDGNFPSGTNRDDYLNWLRKEMYSSIDCVTIDDEDKDDAVSCEVDNSGSEEKEDKTKTDGQTQKDDYFKGYFAFALWGYIPPTGGEQYKTTFIETVIKDDSTVKVKEEGGRKARRENKLVEKMNERGVDKQNENICKLTEMMMKGRKEMQKQRLFKCRIEKIEFEMRYYGTRIKEIRDEMKELMEDADSDSENVKSMKELKHELKLARAAKKDAFQNWKVVTEAEEARRSLLDIADERDDGLKIDNCSSSISQNESETNEDLASNIISPEN